ncbi:CXC-rich protein [Giardia lamblia P15]|uniref:CXC-rich protein n=1 Tax=Giardia intestinalis (strain P15) TaxID=658858 RepID=E1F0Z0_GIAIA|nr:CXC-rich protein [Giardia lamblia P15]
MLTGLALSLVLASLELRAPAASTITTAAELSAIRNAPAGSYTLGADITLDPSYEPISGFTGTLDGANYKLIINGQTGSFGVFGGQFSGSVRNLKLSYTATVPGSLVNPVGALVSVSTGSATIESVFVEGTMTLSGVRDASVAVGGVIGSATEATTLRCPSNPSCEPPPPRAGGSLSPMRLPRSRVQKPEDRSQNLESEIRNLKI